MTTITETMSADHRRCDEIFTLAEEQIAKSDWAKGGAQFEAFRSATEHHFAMEEEIFFPSFEQHTGQTMGPTQMMRSEHMHMRQLLLDMAAALEEQSQQDYLGLSETLMMLMQQHNMKEEQILYPMTDQVFAVDSEEVLQRMEQSSTGT